MKVWAGLNGFCPCETNMPKASLGTLVEGLRFSAGFKAPMSCRYARRPPSAYANPDRLLATTLTRPLKCMTLDRNGIIPWSNIIPV